MSHFFCDNAMTQDNTKNKAYYYYIAAAILILLDQVTKLAVKGFDFFGFQHEGMIPGEQIQVIGDFLQFTFVENAGMAFGITFGVWKIFLSLFSLVAGAGLAYYIFKLQGFSKWVRVGITLIFSGAIGNFIDRAFYGVIFGESAFLYGRVVDFIQVDIPDIDFMGIYYTHWPVFNIADSCVTIGVCLLLIFHNKIPSFREVFPKKESEQASKEPVIDNHDVI